MKIVVEIEEFWIDEEDSVSIEKELKSQIVNEIVGQIRKSMQERIDVQIKSKIDNMYKYHLEKHADKYMDSCFKNAKIKGNFYDKDLRKTVEKEMSLEEYTVKKFENDSGWQSPNEKIEKLCKAFATTFGTEIKARYDLMFATQIVSSLDKEGLLKDNVAKMLMEK